MSNQNEEPAEKKRRLITILLFLLLLAALAVCIVLLLTRKEVAPAEEVASALDRGFVDEDNADRIMDDLADRVAEGMFECEMTMSWTFENGEAESPNAYVANSENNRNTLYFDVYDNSTNEMLYSSAMLPVGSALQNIKLEKNLPAGEYDAVVMYTLVDEDYKEVNKVGFNITISVLH